MHQNMINFLESWRFRLITKTLDQFHLDWFDYSFFLTYFIIFATYVIFNWLTVITFGGLILVFGAWVVYKGKIFYATFFYLIADTCWIINAVKYDDWNGAFFVTLGVIFGLLANWKMSSGKMSKEL